MAWNSLVLGPRLCGRSGCHRAAGGTFLIAPCPSPITAQYRPQGLLWVWNGNITAVHPPHPHPFKEDDDQAVCKPCLCTKHSAP